MKHWWPRLEAVDVPTPDTVLVPVEPDEEGPIPIKWNTEELSDAMENFSSESAFLRTGRKSARFINEGSKIGLNHPEAIDETVMNLLLQMSDMDFLTTVLAIREWLDIEVYAENSLNKISPEVRFFIDDSEVLCWHLRDVDADFSSLDESAEEILDQMRDDIVDEIPVLQDYAERVAQEFTGGWSVDFIKTESDGWYCTDMAPYGLYYSKIVDDGTGEWKSLSAHESGCKHNLEENLPSELPETPQNPREGRRFF